jgi:acetoin utilization deacetylase AcuC-like enzyme
VEYYHGNLLPYAEQASRTELLRAELLKTGLMTEVQVTKALPEAALTRVIDPDMLALLKNVGQEIEQKTFFNQGSQYSLPEGQEIYVYPGFAPIRPFMMRLKESRAGGLGYYFTDKEAPVGAGTYEAALYSATAAYDGALALLSGESRAAYALCRPPGHHAGRDFMGGYCYFNNAAIAATHLRDQLGRVALLDVDYHHGNGSQAIFWDDPQVFFASVHGHPDHEYPYYAGHADETGGDGAPNLTLNLPLPAGTTNEEFLAAWATMLDRTLAFDPVAVVLSLGFDTYEKDPLSTFAVKREAYYQIGREAMALGLPLLVVQEGGYLVEALGDLAEQFFRGVLS